MNEELKSKLRLNIKDYEKINFEKAVNALDEFFFLINNKNKELNEENLLELAKGNYDKFIAWSFEKFLKAFCEIVKPDEYRKNKGNDITLENLYKKVFSLVPQEIKNKDGEKKVFSLSHAAERTAEKFDSYKYLQNEYAYICEFLYLYEFRNKDIVHDNVETTLEENGRALKCLCVCILYLCCEYENILHKKYSFEHFRRELKPNWKENCDSAYQEMIDKIYVDFKWESKIRYETSNIAYQSSEELKGETYLKLIGMAGSGKTTALLHIKHLLLEKYDDDNIFPVFFELKNLTGAIGDFLPYMIEKCYNVPENAAKSLMETDKLIFLLDGYDEIKEDDIRRKFANELEAYAKNNTSVRVIMTDRSRKNSIPVLEEKSMLLRLCSIRKEDKQLYFERNCKDEKILKLLLDMLENDSIVSEILNTPLKLYHFTKISLEDRKIPSDESVFMMKHLRKLFDRERNEKKDTNLDVLKDYLTEISSLSGMENEPFGKKKALSAMAKVDREYGYKNYDTLQALKLAESMGIFEKTNEDTEEYRFSDPDYLAYYRELYDEKD